MPLLHINYLCKYMCFRCALINFYVGQDPAFSLYAGPDPDPGFSITINFNFNFFIFYLIYPKSKTY
jgi:hypothetical protein